MTSSITPSFSEADRETLQKVLEGCLRQRLPAEKWEQFVRQVLSKTSSRAFPADLMFNEEQLGKYLPDPLFPRYIAHALNSQLVTPVDVLAALSKIAPIIRNGGFPKYPLIRIISQAISTWKPSFPLPGDTGALLWNVERTLHEFVSIEDYILDEVLFLEILEAWKQFLTSPFVVLTLKQEKEKNPDQWRSFENDIQDLRRVTATRLSIQTSQEIETTIREFLSQFTTTNGVEAPSAPEIPTIPVLETRASIMMLLISLREANTLGDTEGIWTMIDRLVDGATGSQIFTAIILAAFDALAIVLKRSDMTVSNFPDPLSEVTLYQSILVNRIPALLATRREQYNIPFEEIEYSFMEISAKLDAILLNLNVPTLPTLETGEMGPPIKDFRQDFMYAMVKFGLFDRQAPSRVLGIPAEEIPTLLEVKEIVEDAGDLMDEEGAVERILARLRNLDGNQSITVSAILDLVQMWISSHNIHPLSMLCTGLMRDTTSLDRFFLHTSIPSLVEPLREFLDGWTIDDDDDNGEHQLIYEQYNSILFLICYCVHHFGRRNALDDPDGPGFVRTWLREFSKAKWLDMLSDDDSNAIGIWITALFDGDGISDDLVRMSPPYKWLLISTTLFQQSVSAYRQGVLQLKTLKDGFEYFMQPFLEPCLLGAIHYLTVQLKTSTPETIHPYLEILSSLLEFLSPTQQEDDIFSTIPMEPKTSRVLQILAPSILNMISHLTLDQATPAKHLLDPIVETLRPYSNQLRPDIPMSRKDVITTLRGTLSSLAQWSAGWGSGFVVPQGIDLRYLKAAVRSSGTSVVIRNLVDEMWTAEANYAFHAVVVTGMFLTIPYEIGFGKESLGEKFILMVPEKENGAGTEMDMGRSFAPLTELVQRVIAWQEKTDEIKRDDDEMVDN